MGVFEERGALTVTHETRYQVFIGATAEEAVERCRDLERRLLVDRYLPAGVSGLDRAADGGWEATRREIELSDYFILLLAGDCGPIEPTTGISCAELELRQALQRGVPVLAYQRPTSSEATDAYARLVSAAVESADVRVWREDDDLAELVVGALGERILADEADRRPRPGWSRGQLPFATATANERTLGLPVLSPRIARLGATMAILGTLVLAAWVVQNAGLAGRGSPDSAVYMEAAASLAAGRGLTLRIVPLGSDESSTPLTMFAPGFPVAIAAAGLVTEDRWSAIRLVLSTAVFAYALLCLLLLRLAWPRGWILGPALAAATLLSPGVLEWVEAGLSDLPYSCVALSALAAMLYLQRNDSQRLWKWLLVGLLLGAGTLVRWAGMFGIVAGLAAVAASWRPGATIMVLRRLGAVAVGALLLPLPWALRNLQQGGTVFGERVVSRSELKVVALESLDGISRVFVAPFELELLPGLVQWFGLPVMKAAVLYLIGLALLGKVWKRASARMLFVFGLSWWLLHIFSASMHQVDSLGRGRYWLLLPPVLGALLAYVPAAKELGRGLRWTAGVIFVTALLLQAFVCLAAFDHSLPRAQWSGWFREDWRSSAVVRELQKLEDCDLLAADPRLAMLYYSAGPVSELPTDRTALRKAIREASRPCVFLQRGSLARSKRGSAKMFRKELWQLERAGVVKSLYEGPMGRIWGPAK
jgi:hypothetical protein